MIQDYDTTKTEQNYPYFWDMEDEGKESICFAARFYNVQTKDWIFFSKVRIPTMILPVLRALRLRKDKEYKIEQPDKTKRVVRFYFQQEAASEAVRASYFWVKVGGEAMER